MSDGGTAHVADGPAADADPGGFVRRVLVVAGVGLLAVAAGWAFHRAYDVFFLFGLAVLLGVLLRALADALDRRTRLGPRWSLALVVFAAVSALATAGALVGEVVVAQADRLADDLPRAVARTREYLAGREWGRQVLDHAPTAGRVLTDDRPAVVASAGWFFATTLGVLGNVVVVAFLGLYLAADPRLYTEGLLRLLPPTRRDRGRQVVAAVGGQLRWWLIGRLAAMAAVGLMVGVGLRAIGLPEFLVLALVAAALDIVPYFGPIVAAVPAVLLGLLEGPATAAWVAGLYVLVQSVEGYVLTPLIQQNTVELPPALTIAVIVLAGALFGVTAILVATPLTVAALVAVRMLYVEDQLGERAGAPGSPGHCSGEAPARG